MDDGEPPHYALPVRQWLDVHYSDHWIGRRGSIEWPASRQRVVHIPAARRVSRNPLRAQ
ncbi:hypothetical protein J6590_066680 [Homalodisca vitripennis]|nr:hypothetical protein J6590_066680 [Homalodisca vitripennis]